MHISTSICALLSILAPISHTLCVFGHGGSMRLLREITFSQYIEYSYIIGSFSIIFVCLICPWKKVQTLVTAVFQASSFSSSSLFKNGYSPSHLPNSLFLLECVTAVVAVQHLIILLVLYRFKPPNFDYFKHDRVEVKNTSQPTPELPPPPYEEIGTPMLYLPTPLLIQVANQAEAAGPL